MRKLVVTENITVDGVIDMAGGWFDPLSQDIDQSDITAAGIEHREAADALLVGRNTFEAFRAFWPHQPDDPTGVSTYLNSVSKYVVSGTIDDPGWVNTTVLRGDLVERVQELKAANGRDIVATGSVQLVHALMAERLVDEYRLFVFPVVVGVGARLFEAPAGVLQLLETRPFSSGAVLLRYSTGQDPNRSSSA
jgi:dihydrofolate reductase